MFWILALLGFGAVCLEAGAIENTIREDDEEFWRWLKDNPEEVKRFSSDEEAKHYFSKIRYDVRLKEWKEKNKKMEEKKAKTQSECA